MPFQGMFMTYAKDIYGAIIVYEKEEIMEQYQFFTLVCMLGGGFGWLIHQMNNVKTQMNDLKTRVTVIETILSMVRMPMNSIKIEEMK